MSERPIDKLQQSKLNVRVTSHVFVGYNSFPQFRADRTIWYDIN